jgi:hypothetical protein
MSCSFGNDNSDIQGNWSIVEASRNGRSTSTFENGYIRIWHNDSIETNITGDLIRSSYKYYKKKVITDDILPTFNVIKIEKDTLTFQFLLNETHFHLVLAKTGS